jgi:hypothetical protein
MEIDLTAVFTGKISFAEMVANVHKADVSQLIDELYTSLEAILAETSDAAVRFVPQDPAAADQSEQGWSINHIIPHLTATLEECVATSAMLARGVAVQERLRYETPWEELTTLALVQGRLRESQRMVRAFLDAWPDAPHLDVTITRIPQLGPMNAIGICALGIGHGQSHLPQLREAVRQYKTTQAV